MEDEFKGRNLSEMVKALPSGVTYKWASEEMMHMHTRPEPTMDNVMATHSDLKEQDMSLVQEQVCPQSLQYRFETRDVFIMTENSTLICDLDLIPWPKRVCVCVPMHIRLQAPLRSRIRSSFAMPDVSG